MNLRRQQLKLSPLTLESTLEDFLTFHKIKNYIIPLPKTIRLKDMCFEHYDVDYPYGHGCKDIVDFNSKYGARCKDNMDCNKCPLSRSANKETVKLLIKVRSKLEE